MDAQKESKRLLIDWFNSSEVESAGAGARKIVKSTDPIKAHSNRYRVAGTLERVFNAIHVRERKVARAL